MEESKPESIPVELSKSIYHLIKGCEPVSLAQDLNNGNSKHVEHLSYSLGGQHQNDNSSHLFEDPRLGIKSKSTEHIEVQGDETAFHKSQHIPISYSIHGSEVTPVVLASTDYGTNNSEESRTNSNASLTELNLLTECIRELESSSSLTTECIRDLESGSTTDNNEGLPQNISNVRRAYPSMYSTANDRLPMADLYSQYHILSQHGYNASTSSINTCDTRSSTPTFQSYASALTSASDSNMYLDSEVDLNLEVDNEVGQIEKDKYLRKRKVYGSYDVKSPYLDDSDSYTDVEFEDIKLTSLRPFETPVVTGVEGDLKVTNGGSDRKAKPDVPILLTLKPPSPEPPPLPTSPPPQTPPSPPLLRTFVTDIGDTQVNGNHVVQNMSSEMYKTMKLAITPGKVPHLKKVFADFFHDKNIEDMFSPVQNQPMENQEQPMENQEQTVESLNSVSCAIARGTQPDFTNTNDVARVERHEQNTEILTSEKIHEEEVTERVTKGRAFENHCRVQLVKATLPIPAPKPTLNQKRIQSLDKQKQESKQDLQLQNVQVQPVEQLLPKTTGSDPDYFTGIEARRVGDSGATHSMPGCPVTSSYTQENHVSITDTAAITIAKPAVVTMTPMVTNVIGSVSGSTVSSETLIIPASATATLLLPPAKNEFTETIRESEKGAELLEKAELLSKREGGESEDQGAEEKEEEEKKKENKREVWKEERDEENEGREWKWEAAESGMDLNSVCVVVVPESAVVEEKREEGEERIDEKKKWREKIEGNDKEDQEEKKGEIWKKTEENVQQRQEKGEKQIERCEKQLDKMEVCVTKETESFIDVQTTKIDGKSDSNNEQELQLHLNVTPPTETPLSRSSSHEPTMIILPNKTPESLERSLAIKSKVMPEVINAAESTPTTCVETFSLSVAGYCETPTATSTIGPTTATTTVSNVDAQVSDTPRRFVNSSDPVGHTSYSPIVATAGEESVDSPNVAVPTGQTSNIERILTTVSQVVNLTSTTVSPAAVLQPFQTCNVSKGLLSHDEICGSENLQLEVAAAPAADDDDNDGENAKGLPKAQTAVKAYNQGANKTGEDEWENCNNDNGGERENKESKIEADELVNWERSIDLKKERKEIKGKENEIVDINNQCNESIDEGETRTSFTVRRSNSAFVPPKKAYSLPRTHSSDKLKRARKLTLDSATASDNNEGVTGTISSFKALRRMFEEGRPLKRRDDDEDLPSPIRTYAYQSNICAVDRSNTGQTKSLPYPEDLRKESYLTRRTSSQTAKNRDVYLGKQSPAKINKSEATCKTATTTTTRTTTTDSPIATNINQLSPNASTTRLLSTLTTSDSWSGGTGVETTVQNANVDISVLKNNVSADNPGSVAFSTSHSAEVPLELSTIRKSDCNTLHKANGYDTDSKDLTKTFALEGNAKALPITRLKTVPSTLQDNRLKFDPKYEESKTLERNNDSMDLRNGPGYAPVEKVSSFRIHTHHTDNMAKIEEATQSPNTPAAADRFAVVVHNTTDTKTTEDKNVHSITITGESNHPEDISKRLLLTNRDSNQYVSQIGVNSAHPVPESSQNMLFLGTKEELFAQNDSPKATDSIIVGPDLGPVNMYQLDSNFGAMVSSNTMLSGSLPVPSSVLTPGISTVITNVHLTPIQSFVELGEVNSGQGTPHVNILTANETMRQTVIGTTISAPPPPLPQLTPAHFANQVYVDRNISLNEAISNTAYNVGVDSTSQNTLSNNNEGPTMDSVSVSSPGIQYYSNSQSSTDACQTAALYTTLAPVATGLTSSLQCGLPATWNAGIPIPVTVARHTHHHQQQQEVMQQDLISSPTPSSVYVGSREGTEKSRDETSIRIQGNVSRRVVEFEHTPEDLNFEKQKAHSLRVDKTVDLLGKQEEDAETTYERVKRSLRPIPAKNDNYLNSKLSTIPNLDSSMEDSSYVTDLSSLRSSQTPSYYSVNESIASSPEDNPDQNVTNEVSSDHQYAVVRLTPSNTDYNKVKHTIYCEVSGNGVKNETESPYNLMRQRSDISNVSFSTPSTAASDTEDELSDVTDARSDKQNIKKTRTIYKNTVSVSKQRPVDLVETDSMKTNTYKTETNIFLNSIQPPKSGDHTLHHASDMAIDSGTGTEIISSEGEAESQETTETWCEYQHIPYEKYEQISNSGGNISINKTDASLSSRPSSLYAPAASTITTTAASTTATHYQMNTQSSEFRGSIQATDGNISARSSVSKSDPNNQIYAVHTEPETVSQEGEEDLRIVRGRLLIKNTIDSPKDGDDFDDNINVFAEEFHLDKENPLYQSDPDIFKHTDDEEESELIEEWSEDITFDQVDSMAKNHRITKEVIKTEEKGKQTLSNMLLSRLSNLDSKDIKQSINVEHHHEEIYGDIDFIHADGTKASSDHTENFDSIAENVELLMKSGKAVIVIKVIAERIVPIDYEFNVWRKSSAIVTRQIELDLLANEQRKRLYNHVMENAGSRQAIEPKRYGSYLERTQESHETVLNSRETFRLFNQLLNVAENSGEGGDQNETYSEKTERLALQRPSISDFMY